ncbi:MAG: hypothetical protein KJO07_23985, partial [Deltaproteobacteria bacterium]|nr:hypothetical protein [Deltaproteobacteria bacterium]
MLVVDAADGPSEQDARLGGLIEENGRAVVVALNKSDLLGGPGAAKEVMNKLADEVGFLKYAPSQLVSAVRGDGVLDLMDRVKEVREQHEKRISTADINKFYAEVCETHPPPVQSGRAVRISYVTQATSKPPTFLVFCNHPKYLAESYKRYLVNQLRKRYGFKGTPI